MAKRGGYYKVKTVARYAAKLKKKSTSSDNVNMSNVRRGRTSGSKNFSADEAERLLDLVEERKTIGAEQWKSLAERFNRVKEVQRDYESIKRKFDRLVNVKMLSVKWYK
eukprot:TRINITY_DN7203_c0_g1_i6.p1 TRINITY_DN7203_c0_g1~~TRINITY_DN7203_c0_g1_i6.p1  ORF type:complete len:109 (-),score=39.94 TRINITY_DN7203_c0_g1_i6:207-533(-)